MGEIVYEVEGFRTEEPATTLEWLRERSIPDRLGLERAASGEVGGVPVRVYLRPASAGRQVHAGKGTTEEQSAVSGIMESVERASAEPDHHDALRDPEPGNVWVPPWYRTEPRGWMPAEDLTEGGTVHVPANEVLHPWPEDELPSHTNGLAAGRTREEAIVQGLLEVLERDAWSVFEYHREPAPELRLHGRLERLRLAIGEDVGGEIHLRLLPSRVPGVYAVGAVAEAPSVREMVLGFGCSPDPEMAALRALLEVAQGVFMAREGFEGARRVGPMGGKLTPERLKRINRHWFRSEGEVELDDLENELATRSLDKLLKELVDRVRESGLGRVIAADLTRDDLGVPVVRVRVTGAAELAVDERRVGNIPEEPPRVDAVG
ncbi:MAG: YcaO-like family protein [Methanopyraceae archaeon]